MYVLYTKDLAELTEMWLDARVPDWHNPVAYLAHQLPASSCHVLQVPVKTRCAASRRGR
jgi:hypothetical protein